MMSNRTVAGTNQDDSVFDDPLMTPPTTDAETGTWDDEGPIRGWEFRPDTSGVDILDLVLEREWTIDGLQCLLLRVTEYVERGTYARDEPYYGESETYYRGYVHAPDVESFQKGYCGTYITDCYPDDGWFCWDERAFDNRPGMFQSMRESAIGKTETLAEGLVKEQSNSGIFAESDSHE